VMLQLFPAGSVAGQPGPKVNWLLSPLGKVNMVEPIPTMLL
jgi:hypothetical protein